MKRSSDPGVTQKTREAKSASHFCRSSRALLLCETGGALAVNNDRKGQQILEPVTSSVAVREKIALLLK